MHLGFKNDGWTNTRPYLPRIIPFIDAEIGSKFERDEEGDFVLLDEEDQ